MAKTLDLYEYPNNGAAQAAYPTDAGLTKTFSHIVDGGYTGYQTYTLRTIIPAAALSYSASTIKVLLKGNPSVFGAFDKIYIGHQGAGDPWDFDGNQVEVKFGGTSGVGIAGGETELSDEVIFSLDSSKVLVIAVDLTSVVGEGVWGKAADADYSVWRKAAADEAHLTAPSGYDIMANILGFVQAIYGDVKALQCYSENTIVQQGSYSLKVEATQTESLNKTLTKTLTGGDKIDLSGIDDLELYVYASRTGTNIEVKIHDSGGNTITISIAIPTAGVWTKIEKDISAVTDVDKDDIDEIKIQIIQAGAANTFYVDNFKETEIPAFPISRLNKNRLMGYHCFMDQYLRAKREGLTPLKLPDGTVW